MTAEPPVAPAPVAPVGASTPAPKPNISPAPANIGIPAPVEATPAKPGSTRESIFSKLESKAKVEGAPVAPSDKKPAEAKAPDAKPADPKVEPADEPTEEQIAAEKAAAADPKKKVNPWKLYKEEKAARTKLEQEYAEARKAGIDPAVRKSELEKYSAIEKRAKELEDHIRFVDYSKSAEFQEKYEQPYAQAFTRAMTEVGEIAVVDPQTGKERPFNSKDMLDLVNMPLNKARELATDMVGEAADDVMAYRKEIRGLWDAQATALEKARKEGGERLKAMQEEGQTKAREVSDFVAQSWETANKKLMEDPKIGQFFKAADGDAEGKTILEKGYKFIDSAFAQNPMDPKLSAEDRAKVVERQAAARHRAAGFGYARHLAETRAARISELEAKLAEYEKSTPDLGGGAPPNGTPAPVDKWARLNSAIEAKARPGL